MPKKTTRDLIDAQRGMNPLAAALANAGVVSKNAIEKAKAEKVAAIEAALPARPTPRRKAIRYGKPVAAAPLAEVERQLGVTLPPSFRKLWLERGGFACGDVESTPVSKLVAEARSLAEVKPREAPPFPLEDALVVAVHDGPRGVGYYVVPLRVRDARGESPVYFTWRDEYAFERVAEDADDWLRQLSEPEE